MKVELEKHGSVSVVIPRDSLNESSVADLKRALESEARPNGVRLVFDLTHVPFADSAGIEFLLQAAGSAPSATLRPRLAGLSPTLREALYLTDTLKRFYVFDSVEAAVRSYV